MSIKSGYLTFKDLLQKSRRAGIDHQGNNIFNKAINKEIRIYPIITAITLTVAI